MKNASEGKHSKEFLITNNEQKADKLLQLSRYDVSRYVSLITGHGQPSLFYV